MGANHGRNIVPLLVLLLLCSVLGSRQCWLVVCGVVRCVSCCVSRQFSSVGWKLRLVSAVQASAVEQVRLRDTQATFLQPTLLPHITGLYDPIIQYRLTFEGLTGVYRSIRMSLKFNKMTTSRLQAISNTATIHIKMCEAGRCLNEC